MKKIYDITFKYSNFNTLIVDHYLYQKIKNKKKSINLFLMLFREESTPYLNYTKFNQPKPFSEFSPFPV